MSAASPASVRFALAQPNDSSGGWRAALARHLARLDLPARINRFLSPARDEAIRAYADRAQPLFLITAGSGGRLIGVAEVHPHATLDRSAEIAVSVDTEWRNHGIGHRLFEKALEECRRRGIDDLWVVYLRGNQAMRRIAERSGFVQVPDADPDCVTAHLIDLPRSPRTRE
ncbi:acetyltransferase (GNAT) family protein [Albidovulum inexpectatum]|uniref:Acetyltransferase (GNAT) family protein n=1 Tax=Albidovulum inexpectatum TaxID=196587 RepID=A0A2S5JF78_9RHOB|nr:GNAT family N-acetyltransferase [Albidovulum inexpectatum]PPB80166.1 acetyltransferase (GNAT) family protein [Albidovulum inexpectatum]